MRLIKNLSEHKTFLFSLAFCWTVLIAILCLISFRNLPTIKISGIDKYVHFTFHFVFVILWGCYTIVKRKNFGIKELVVTVLVSFVYGVIIEVAQELLTTTRHADVQDVLANIVGAITAFVIFVIFKNTFDNQKIE